MNHFHSSTSLASSSRANYAISYAYSALLLSGVWKSYIDAFNSNLPDITFILAAINALLLLVKIINGNGEIKVARYGRAPLFALVALFSWSVFTSVYTLSSGTYLVKLVSLLLCLFVYIFPLMVGEWKQYVRAFLNLCVITSVVFIVVFPRIFASRSLYDNSVISVYLQAGYVAGAAILLNIRSLTGYGLPKTLLFSAIYLLCLLVSGARGPIIFVLASPLVAYLGSVALGSGHRISKRVALSALLLLILLVLAVYIVFNIQNDLIQGLLDRTTARFSALLGNGQVTSLDDREQYALFSLEAIVSGPWRFLFGSGIGSFGQLYTGQDIKLYPHNVILEVWVELGLVGLLSYIVFLCSSLLSLRKAKHIPIITVFIYFFLNSLKSFSIADSRIMFGVIAVLLLVTWRVRNDRVAKF